MDEITFMEPKEDKGFFRAEAENKKEDNGELLKLLQTLEQQMSWDGTRLAKYEGYWCPVKFLPAVLSTQKHFKAKDTDIILASLPKCGTTWLKALTYSILNRNVYSIDQTPLLASNPHKLVRVLELDIYGDQESPDLGHIPSPRIFSTHLSYNTLPKSILESKSRIIYICRNPLDHFISHRLFLLANRAERDAAPLELEESFDLFCKGIHPQGPFWDHFLGYWNAHLRNPQKFLFLKYEDLKEDIAFNLKRIAEFMGFPFSLEEEKDGLIQQISNLCSFDKLGSLEVNKTDAINVHGGTLKNSTFFRKGQVGDWTSYLTPDMEERFKKVMDSKLTDFGLTSRWKIKGIDENNTELYNWLLSLMCSCSFLLIFMVFILGNKLDFISCCLIG